MKKGGKDKKASVPFWNKPNPVPTRLCHVLYNHGDIKVSQPNGNMVKRRSITLLKSGCFAWSFRGSR